MLDILLALAPFLFVCGIAGALVWVGHRIADEQQYEARLRRVYGSTWSRTK